jgi:hypothetical protein
MFASCATLAHAHFWAPGLRGIPNAPPGNPPASGAIKQKPVVFGLHNHYYREAA